MQSNPNYQFSANSYSSPPQQFQAPTPVSTLEGPRTNALPPGVPVAPSGAASFQFQNAKELFQIIKGGIVSDISSYIDRNNLDVTKIVDDNFRHTCLYYSALIPDPEAAFTVMKMLLERGVSATYTDILNQTVLYYASREGKVKCVDLLLKYGCKANHKDQYGQTSLFYAAREGHCEIAQMLLDSGAGVDIEDYSGQTALFYAAREGKKAICELLVKYGANPNKLDFKRQSALYWAKKFDRIEVMNYLLSCGVAPIKEPTTVPKAPSKSSSSHSKRRDDRREFPKRYLLQIYDQGMWRKLSRPELEQFFERQKEVAGIISNPKLLDSLKLPAISPSAQIYDHWEKAAKRILNYLWKQQSAWHFHQPVNPDLLRIPDYLMIIKHPMDFGTIKTKLNSCQYSRCQEFIDDVELVFSNCILYNGERSEFGFLAANLREVFKKQCEALSLNYYL